MQQQKLQLEGRRVLITGGSGGIGSVIASHFCANGATVCIVGSHAGRLLSALKSLDAKHPGQVYSMLCDVGDWDSVAQLMPEAARLLGGIDILVNAAGIQAPIGEFVVNEIAAWERNIRVNLLGAVYCCKAALPFLLEGRDACIINFSGGGATSSRENFSAYAVAKTGLVRFTEVLADELRDRQVRVNAIAPGAINTHMLDEVIAAGAKAGVKEMQEATVRSANGGASADLAAELVLFLASPRSAGLTGKLISAVWDPWKSWDRAAIEEVMSGTKYNLRRV